MDHDCRSRDGQRRALERRDRLAGGGASRSFASLTEEPNITVAINDPLGQVSWLVMNHLFPPSMTCGRAEPS